MTIEIKKILKDAIKAVFIFGIIIILIWIVSAEFGETNTEFSLATAQSSCQFNAEGDVSYWVWWEDPPGTLHREEVGFPLSSTKFSCYREGGWPSWGCCPGEIQCNPPTSPVPVELWRQCYNFAPYFCSDYNEYSDPEYYCKAFNINTAIRSVEKFTGIPGICSGNYYHRIPDGTIPGRINCVEYTSNCRCYWDEAALDCRSTSTSYIFCDGVQYEGNCTQDTVQKINECNEKGVITYIWEAMWNMSGTPPPAQSEIDAARPDDCKDGNKTFPCNIIKLNFFTFMNIILFILFIAMIYFFINKKRRKIIKED